MKAEELVLFLKYLWENTYLLEDKYYDVKTDEPISFEQIAKDFLGI